ncbi:hypothetical protein AM629_20760, partial [Photorhabdus heterorhabditis]
QWDDKNYHLLPNGEVKYDIRKDKLVVERASIIAKGHLVADFSDSIPNRFQDASRRQGSESPGA